MSCPGAGEPPPARLCRLDRRGPTGISGVVMSVEQRQMLVAVHRIAGVADFEGDSRGGIGKLRRKRSTSAGSHKSRMQPASVSARPSRRSASRIGTTPPSKPTVTFLRRKAGRSNGRRVSAPADSSWLRTAAYRLRSIDSACFSTKDELKFIILFTRAELGPQRNQCLDR